MRTYLKKIIKISQLKKKQFVFVTIITLVLGLFEILSLGLLIPYINTVLQPSFLIEKIDILAKYKLTDKQIVILSSSFILVVFFLKTIIQFYMQKYIILICSKCQYELKLVLMNGYQNQLYLNFTENNSASYFRSINQLSNQFAFSIFMPILKILNDLFFLSIIVCILIFVNYQIVFFTILILLIFFLFFTKFFNKKLISYGLEINASTKKMIKIMNEAFTGFKEIRLLNKEKFFFNNLAENAFIYFKKNKNKMVINSLPKILLEFLAFFLLIILIFYTLIFDKNIQEYTPTITFFAFALIKIIPLVNSIINNFTQLKFSKNSLKLLDEDLNKFATKKKLLKNCKIDYFKNFKSIELKQINFNFQNSKTKTLSNINFKILKGKSYGIFGPSGSGKTTLIDILIGIIEPNSGKILINDRVINYENRNYLKEKIAYLPQQVFIIDGTILENIILDENEDSIDIKKINHIIKISDLESLIKKSQYGLNTHVGENGIKISGGQRQKISIARSLYHDKNIFVIDEATSNIDLKSENKIVNDLNKLKLTNIIISHRSKSMLNCDYVYYMEDGKIIDCGKPGEIVQKYD
tara:strand:- start:630 stop:2375 length:1746 start_codon:yes stop_codon:yes gene_type:complete